MIGRRFAPPPPRPASLDRDLQIGRAASQWTMGFVGDICPLFGREAQFGADVRAFLADCDVIVGNFEGVFSDRFWKPFLMKHDPSIFEVLKQIAPLERWVVSVANNHATDFGPEALRRTLEILDRRGVRWLGTAERPRLALADDVTLTAWTWWLNRPADGVAREDPGAPTSSGLHVALPHWGYEHERQPRPSQTVPEGYVLTVGHHTHLPQPFEQTRDGRLVAWSLGNLITGKQLPVLGEGALLKVGVARPGEEAPEIVRAQFREIDLERSHRYCRVSFRQAAAPSTSDEKKGDEENSLSDFPGL